MEKKPDFSWVFQPEAAGAASPPTSLVAAAVEVGAAALTAGLPYLALVAILYAVLCPLLRRRP